MVSRQFVEAVKLAPRQAYKIAHEAGIHPSTLSKILNGIDHVRCGDPRVVAVGAVLELAPEECFEEDSLATARKGRP